MAMKFTVKEIHELDSELKYLREEYKGKTLWATQDGDVSFDKLMDFLENEDNREMVKQMLSVAEKLDR